MPRNGKEAKAPKATKAATAVTASSPVAGPAPVAGSPVVVGGTYDQGSERFARLLRKARRRVPPPTTASDVARDVVLLLEQVHLVEHERDQALIEDVSRRYGWTW